MSDQRWFDEERLKRALEVNDAIGEEGRVPGAQSSRQHGDFVAPSGLAIGAVFGLDTAATNRLVELFADHVSSGRATVIDVMDNPVSRALALGMMMGWFARVREEMDDPEEVIVNQVIGYLKGKATAMRDEMVNADPAEQSELNKQATACELAAEALEAENED